MKRSWLLGCQPEQRENKALKASFSASSVRSPRTSKVEIETQPNCPWLIKLRLSRWNAHIYITLEMQATGLMEHAGWQKQMMIILG